MRLDRQLGSLAQLVLARTAPAFLALADERLTTLVVAQEMEDLDRMRDLAQAWKASAMSVGARPETAGPSAAGAADSGHPAGPPDPAGRLLGPSAGWRVAHVRVKSGHYWAGRPDRGYSLSSAVRILTSRGSTSTIA